MAGQLLPTFLPLYFKENLSKANGVAVAGSSLGSFIYFPLYECLLNVYGTSGAFLIVSAICLNALPAAMFLLYSQRHLELSTMRKHVEGDDLRNRQEMSIGTSTANDPCKTMGLDEDQLKPERSCITTYERNSKHLGTTTIDHNKDCTMYTSMTMVSYCLADNEKRCTVNSNFNKNCKERSSFTECSLHSEVLQSNWNAIEISTDTTTEDSGCKHFSSVNQDSKTGCTCVPGYRNQSPTKSHEVLNALTLQVIPKRKLNWEGFTLFYDPLFLVLSFTQSSFLITIQLFASTIVDFALDKGIPTSLSVYALMLCSISDLFGRLFLGFVTDAGCMSASSFSALCYFCVAIGFTGISLSSEFLGLLASLCFYAVFVGGHMLISPVLVSKYFDGERRTMAMTTRFVLAVPMYFAVSPLIGKKLEYGAN